MGAAGKAEAGARRRGGVRVHRVVAAVVRAAFAARRRGGARTDGGVCLLLLHAWGTGGTVRTVFNLAAELAPHHDVEVLSLVRRRDEPGFAVPPGVRVTALDDQRPGHGARGRVATRLRRRRSRLLHPADPGTRAATLWTDLLLARRLWRARPAVLIATRPALNLAVADLAPSGAIVVGQEHLHLAAHSGAVNRDIARRYAGLDAVVVLTEADRRAYARHVGHATRVVRLPNAVTPLGGPAPSLTAPVILAAGRLTNQKGFDLLIRAFARVAREAPAWTLRICGSGRERAALRQLVRTLGLAGRVQLPGRVADMGAEMGGASLFVLSSRFEGFPMVLLEAMGKGLPVVSFDCPTGPGELLRPDAGILVAREDVDALAEAILALVGDEARRRRCAAAGQAVAAGYGRAVIGARWEALLAELAAARG